MITKKQNKETQTQQNQAKKGKNLILKIKTVKSVSN